MLLQYTCKSIGSVQFGIRVYQIPFREVAARPKKKAKVEPKTIGVSVAVVAVFIGVAFFGIFAFLRHRRAYE